MAALLNCLYKHGLSEDYLASHLLGVATAGASVMLGCKTGVVTQLKRKFSNVISWHCLNHRLELGVHDAVKACTEINHFKLFMDKLCSLYSMSPKSQRALESCAATLGLQLNRIGRVLDVRWVASSFRAVSAVWKCYAALHQHFKESAVDRSLDSKERATFSGLLGKLESGSFLLNLALMHDALEELAELSESLQADSMTLPRANRLICRQIEIFRARKMTPGDCEKTKIATDAVKIGKFETVTLKPISPRDAVVNRQQFYQALCDSLAARMLPDSDSQLMRDVEILLPSSWPDSTAMPPEYGESELRRLCSRLLVPYTVSVKNAYRDFKESGGSRVAHAFKQVQCSLACLPVSTAVCERGFSRMNIVCTPTRSTLTMEHLSSLLLISIVGAPHRKWQPMP